MLLWKLNFVIKFQLDECRMGAQAAGNCGLKMMDCADAPTYAGINIGGGWFFACPLRSLKLFAAALAPAAAAAAIHLFRRRDEQALD
jgi:hypothetical protein